MQSISKKTLVEELINFSDNKKTGAQVLMEVGRAAKILSSTMFTLKPHPKNKNGKPIGGNSENEEENLGEVISEENEPVQNINWEGEFTDDEKNDILKTLETDWVGAFKKELIILKKDFEKFEKTGSEDFNCSVMNETGHIIEMPFSYLNKFYGIDKEVTIKMRDNYTPVLKLVPKNYKDTISFINKDKKTIVKRVLDNNVSIFSLPIQLFRFLFTTNNSDSSVDNLLDRLEVKLQEDVSK